MWMILFVLIVAFMIYALIPTLLFRLFSIKKSIQKDNDTKIVHLTFDDGPNPLYTPLLLDLLRLYNAKATFFVLGKKAEKYPELILRMKEEGHTIGIHNDKHTSNWFTDPFTFYHQLKKATARVEKITGEKPYYYRPPWGHFNLFSWTAMKDFKIIMWKYAPRDWNVMETNTLTDRLLSHLENRSIILLHDCGETFGADKLAPGIMLDALRKMFVKTANQGILFHGLEEDKANSPNGLTNRSRTSF
ncbi:polysaccharide deacetylase family protein [Bacillus sp. NEB1478]|uniref:polysaccharide deacetylase family protein n=1 Tax=Bacillus sp. NEB1478 TaxID=3073816 RepID=UPI002873264F|nr:polysaccharide deacetylase family protein [Bacillus sp. NEB1478]WNB91133.1 polysaccharide deacetylase family protein [Bacillus sp. NEB1478]